MAIVIEFCECKNYGLDLSQMNMNMDGVCFICNTLETCSPQKRDKDAIWVKKAIEMLLNMSTTREDNLNKKNYRVLEMMMFGCLTPAVKHTLILVKSFKQDKAGGS